MLSFLDFNNFLTESVEHSPTHSDHIEDLIFINGHEGLLDACHGIIYLAKSIGNGKIAEYVTLKHDGAPSIFAGYIGGKFFVATKSIFNKTPKINYTVEDIKKNHKEGVAAKLEIALKYLPKVIPDGKIYQGDFLYDKSTLEEKTVNDIDYWTFRPNTIMYSIPKDSSVGKEITQSEMGITFHTEYKQDGENKIKFLRYNVDKNEFKDSSDVWITDANCKDIKNLKKFSPKELAALVNRCSNLISLGRKVNWNMPKVYNDYAMMYINQCVRDKKTLNVEEFVQYLKEKMPKKYIAGLSEFLYKEDYRLLFYINTEIAQMKNVLLNKLNVMHEFNAHLEKLDGEIEDIDDEGFIITNSKIRGVKLVNRKVYSRANFMDNEYKMGWKKNERKKEA